ncbi:hypothetical protein CTI12_AA348910 [Artemisia annua]|uniref:Uncharacterized protein n=1 Tax=Artemisia annua TaxID=35608 RepID=A0A2U1MS89_ARTAN|nr:hypothetical protein CTI12_AA348910 [Artemisia annua]
MEGNYSDQRSIAELDKRFYLWENHSDIKDVYVQPTHSSRSRIKDKLEDGFEKMKEVAATGFKKIKHGSTTGFHWIKHECQKTMHKQTY